MENIGGAAGGTGRGYGESGGFEDFDFGGFGGGGFSSFFEELFGHGGFGSGRGFSSRQSQSDYNMNATVDIDMYTALLGGQIILKTSSVKLKLNVKPGTQNGTKARLKGKGYQKPDGSYGDLILTYNVKLPMNLTAHQKELWNKCEARRFKPRSAFVLFCSPCMIQDKVLDIREKIITFA